MIDKVQAYIIVNINENDLDMRKWHAFKSEATGEPYFVFNRNLVRVLYFPATKRLVVKGRLINLSEAKGKVANMDILYTGLRKTKLTTKTIRLSDEQRMNKSTCDSDGKLYYSDVEQEITTIEYIEQDHKDIISKINQMLYELTKHKLDLNDFKVTRIEFCFNIRLESQTKVERYIELLNKIFDAVGDKRYRNYVIERNRPKYGSFYIQTKAEYNKNTRNNYRINFYNKLDQLQNLKKNSGRVPNPPKISADDMAEAKSVLRMEVQAYHKLLKKASDDYGLIGSARGLGQFLDPMLCGEFVLRMHERFIGEQDSDFYTYKAAKIKIQDSILADNQKKNVIKYLEKLTKNAKVCSKTHIKYRKILKSIGIHWFLIPKQWGVDYMESLAKLLKQEVENIRISNMNYLNGVRIFDDGWIEEEDLD